MSDKSKPTDWSAPATDEEIAEIGAWNCDCSTNGPNHPWQCLMVFGPRLIARIGADARVIAELEDAIMPEHDLGISFDACCGRDLSHETARAILARKAGGGE